MRPSVRVPFSVRLREEPHNIFKNIFYLHQSTVAHARIGDDTVQHAMKMRQVGTVCSSRRYQLPQRCDVWRLQHGMPRTATAAQLRQMSW